MCTKGVGWEPISDIVDRLVEELASAPHSSANARVTAAQRVSGRGSEPNADMHAHCRILPSGVSAARHSAEAELNGLAVGPTREAHGPTATAQPRASSASAGRAHTTLAGATGVVIEMRGSRAVDWGGGTTRLLDDGLGSRARPGDRKPGSAGHGIALCAKR